MGDPRAFRFSKELALPCDLQPVQGVRICELVESDEFNENVESNEEVEDSDTLAQVLLSLNLQL